MSPYRDAVTESKNRERAGGRTVLFVLVGLVVLVGGAYVAAYFASSDRVPRGASVEGVDIGGKTRAQAIAAIEDGLADRAAAPIQFEADGKQDTVSAERVGLSVDYAASVDQVGTDRSWNPAWLWSYFTGGDDVEAVFSLDQRAMDDFLDGIQDEHGSEPVDGAIRFRGSRYVVKKARDGAELDRETAQEALSETYLTDGTAELPIEVVPPEIGEDAVRAAVDGFANPAISGAVRIAYGKATAKLTPAQYLPAVSLQPEDGALVPTLDEKKLDAVLDQHAPAARAAVDATVRMVDGKPTVIPGKPGMTYDADAVADGFLEVVAAAPEDRVLEVDSKVEKPDFTVKDARDLQIKEQVSTFTTYYPHADYRNINIGRAAQLINGTVLKPGETFSLNDTVGERTAANGFTEGYVISNGILVKDLGGGVSQMATTLFNAMFFAGLKDVEHKPHSFYIDRYPVGREATVAWGAVDLRFKNDTPYGILIQTSVQPSSYSSSGVVTASMYSTKYWDITTTTGQRYNFTSPQTRQLSTSDCEPSVGYGGFDINVWRYFRKPGESKLERTEQFHTRYIPADEVVCVN